MILAPHTCSDRGSRLQGVAVFIIRTEKPDGERLEWWKVKPQSLDFPQSFALRMLPSKPMWSFGEKQETEEGRLSHFLNALHPHVSIFKSTARCQTCAASALHLARDLVSKGLIL